MKRIHRKRITELAELSGIAECPIYNTPWVLDHGVNHPDAPAFVRYNGVPRVVSKKAVKILHLADGLTIDQLQSMIRYMEVSK